jgi:hypothetical protein
MHVTVRTQEVLIQNKLKLKLNCVLWPVWDWIGLHAEFLKGWQMSVYSFAMDIVGPLRFVLGGKYGGKSLPKRAQVTSLGQNNQSDWGIDNQ